MSQSLAKTTDTSPDIVSSKLQLCQIGRDPKTLLSDWELWRLPWSPGHGGGPSSTSKAGEPDHASNPTSGLTPLQGGKHVALLGFHGLDGGSRVSAASPCRALDGQVAQGGGHALACRVALPGPVELAGGEDPDRLKAMPIKEAPHSRPRSPHTTAP